ncbi:MAG: hypothetical protein CVV27_03030 [Candidatus Melainabacteria bacterium HGW-Melainabacteria-1]|nr:MAG: hypothetical protein CVV27_03030 [Candidatus Melainabacteria bacterium HGW-Melainabacteria-1]
MHQLNRRLLTAIAAVALALPQTASAVGNVDVKAVDHGPGKLKEVKAVGYIDAPPAKVWKAIIDYGGYAKFMPRMKKSTLETRNANMAIATMYLDLPFPFSGTWYTNRYDENPKAMSLKWRMLKGSIKHTDGGWSLKAQGKGTLATYIVRTDPGVPLIPKILADEATKRTIPDIFKAVERRAKQL